ncbi:MAG: hypothetical protein ACJAS1_004721 [Oleiphilaceae bacterium]|jgi:hypothetical protein
MTYTLRSFGQHKRSEVSSFNLIYGATINKSFS